MALIKIKFRKMTNESIVKIDERDLGCHIFGEQKPTTFNLIDKNDEELPEKVIITHIDPEYEYNQSTQISKTLSAAIGQVVSIPVPIAFKSSKARKIADQLKLSYLIKNIVDFTFSLNNASSYLEPCDVVTVDIGTQEIDLRIIKKDNFNGVLQFTADRHTSYIYNQDDLSDSEPLGGLNQTIKINSPTKAYYLDIPILRDADDDYGMYVLLSGYFENWEGGSLFQSIDSGENYINIVSSTSIATTGKVINLLGDFLSGNIVDELNYMEVVVNSALESCNLLELYSGENSCIVGKDGRYEIISFRSAELISTGKYKLTGLLRGRKGTEQHIGTHQEYDDFILISANEFERILTQENKINFEFLYRPVSFGENINNSSIEKYTNTGNGLKPYSPVHGHYGIDASGNRLLQWKRRTRINGGWVDSTDVSLGETSLIFSIDFINASDAVVRTVNEITAEQYLYEDYATDFPSGNGRAIVYQVSETVGRGFPLEIDLD